MLYFVFLVIYKLATDLLPTPVRPWPSPRMMGLVIGLVLRHLYGQSLALALTLIVRPCPWPCPRLARPQHNTGDCASPSVTRCRLVQSKTSCPSDRTYNGDPV